MANDRETKSFEVRPDKQADYSAARRARPDQRVTRGEAGATMADNRDADLHSHGEAGSSGTGKGSGA